MPPESGWPDLDQHQLRDLRFLTFCVGGRGSQNLTARHGQWVWRTFCSLTEADQITMGGSPESSSTCALPLCCQLIVPSALGRKALCALCAKGESTSLLLVSLNLPPGEMADFNLGEIQVEPREQLVVPESKAVLKNNDIVGAHQRDAEGSGKGSQWPKLENVSHRISNTVQDYYANYEINIQDTILT